MKDGPRNAPLLRRLREETADLHARLDGAPTMRALLDPDLTLGDYVACLARLHPVYAALDRSLAVRLSAAVPDLERRRKAPAIARDLHHLGHAPDDSGPGTPRWASAAEAWGALYVVEGATLGGAVISRALALHPWFDGLQGRTHFAAYGSETGEMWSRFRHALLAARGEDTAFDEAALRGARAGFGMFLAQMEAAPGHAAA